MFSISGAIEVKETVPLVSNKSKVICSSCSGSATTVPPKIVPKSPKPVEKQEISCQTETPQDFVKNIKNDSNEVSTQTASRWVQISLNSPPLSLTQEVPDVVL